jgi:hypothetical protein
MRSDASQLYQSVSDGQDISVLSYHGDMPHKRRTENLEAFSTVCSLACPTSPPGSEHHAVPSAPSPTVLRCLLLSCGRRQAALLLRCSSAPTSLPVGSTLVGGTSSPSERTPASCSLCPPQTLTPCLARVRARLRMCIRMRECTVRSAHACMCLCIGPCVG